jgi:hypothetical protein
VQPGAPANIRGGGVSPHGEGAIQNTVLAYNTSTTDGTTIKDNCLNPVPTLGGNVADDTSCNLGGSQGPNDKDGTDPALGGLGNNGGQTDTRSIASSSAAFNNAVNSGGASVRQFGDFRRSDCPNHDQRDLPRPALGGCDSGAYELQPAPPAVVTPVLTPAQVIAARSTPAAPTLRLAGARAGCARSTTRLRVRLSAASGLRSVKVTLGSKVIKRTKSTNFTLSIRRSQLRVGHNVVKIVVTDAQGRHATRRAPLTRCRVRVAPHFTG